MIEDATPPESAHNGPEEAKANAKMPDSARRYRHRFWKILQGPSLADWLVASATLAIAITSYYQWKAINGQLGEMVNSGTQTDKIVTASRNIQIALENANKNNQDALKATLGQSQNALNASLGEMAKQRLAMETNANAAKSAAETAASQLELAERPWVDADIELKVRLHLI